MKLFNRKAYNVHERAKDLHNKLGKATQDKTTTAIGLTDDECGIVGSSEGKLRKSIKKWLFDFEVEAKGKPHRHAEENVMDEAGKREKKLTEIGASRPICKDCQEQIEEQNIQSGSPFSGKKSKKRK